MALAALLGLAPRSLAAQNGGLFLAAPFGARAVAQGQAVVADSALGTEGIWWNPAALARLSRREVAIHHSETVAAVSDMLTVAVPSRVLGTVAVSAYLVDYGQQQSTDPQTGIPTGTISNQAYQLGASYASAIGDRLRLGLTYKFVLARFACSGACGAVPVYSGRSSALDLGVQYQVPTRWPVSLGASVRNVGPALQVKDREQRDPLPRIVQLGTRVDLPLQSLNEQGLALAVMADVLNGPVLGGSSLALGAELGYRDQLFLRGGYRRQAADLASGPSVGIGVTRGALSIEIARWFDQLSSQLGQTPTYFMLRGRF